VTQGGLAFSIDNLHSKWRFGRVNRSVCLYKVQKVIDVFFGIRSVKQNP
jgi:hypothetical protein